MGSYQVGKLLQALIHDEPSDHLLEKLDRNDVVEANFYDYLITERQKKEKLLSKIERLAEVNVRSAEMMMEMEDLKKQAEISDKSKSTFLATMSHEIRTPMNGIIGMTEVLMDNQSLDEEGREALETIRNCGNSLVEIINDILDLSKISAGMLKLENIDFNLHQTISEIYKLFLVSANEKGVQLNIDLANCKHSAYEGDPTRLRQVLLNLIGNALKFTEKGSVILKLSSVGEENSLVKFEIIDSGIGIPIEKQNKLFKDFSQVDESTTRKFGGTGLGLSICKKIVEMMHGKIGVKSDGETGSNFWFEIPLKKIEEREKVDVTNFNFTTQKILFVDDQAMYRRQYKQFAEQLGCKYDTAKNGQDAITKVNEAAEKFDFIVTDAYMPEMDGLTLCNKLQANEATKNIPVLIATSSASRGDVEKYKAAGGKAYLHKPVQLDILQGALLYLIENENKEFFTRFHMKKASLSEYKILVAEDNPVNMKVMTKMFDKMNVSFDKAHNGQEAVDLHQQNQYDVILMDMQMPVLDGVEATTEIRKTDTKTVIIALTANVMDEDRKRCFDAGMNAFLIKPVKGSQLSEVMENVLAN